MPSVRLLTKSRFKLACECPAKLFFTKKESEYFNGKLEDTFLKALANGGFQVGALAKTLWPNGKEVETLDYEEAVKQTDELLRAEDVVIFEAAFKHENLFVRVDVLIKSSNKIELIEVKSKTWDPENPWAIFNKNELKKGRKVLGEDKKSYLLDLAFQTYVASKSKPEWTISPSFLLVNKRAQSPVDGLNQLFLIRKSDNRRNEVTVSKQFDPAVLPENFLFKAPMTEEVRFVIEDYKFGNKSFTELVAHFSDAYASDTCLPPVLSKECKKCEFRAHDVRTNLKNGFVECWGNGAGLKEADFKRPMVFEIWNYRDTDDKFSERTFFIDQLDKDSFVPKTAATRKKHAEAVGLSPSARQWLQAEKIKNNDSNPYFDIEGMKSELGNIKFPLHFIDFETATVAIPFHKGKRPYEQIAFQFSHHTIDKDGKVSHADEFIDLEQGKFPNFTFLRALKKSLENDVGTIFIFSPYENTVLCQIYDQLATSNEPDTDQLQSFIRSITKSKEDSERGEWSGPREMIDMCELVKRYYFSPLMGGSNSIKKVLPAVLQESAFLRELYSKPIYGAEVSSKNFKNHSWIHVQDNGWVQDPYKALPEIFSGISEEMLNEFMFDGDELRDGGTAMMAYAKSQFTEMSTVERNAIRSALLRYCELDTLAMVMIFQHWSNLMGVIKGKKVA